MRDSLSLALGALDDRALESACVVDVCPQPDAGHLCVVISASVRDVEGVRDALARSGAFLRRELASAIARKRVPELAFEVIGGER